MFTKILLVAVILIVLLMWWRHATIVRLKHDMMERMRSKPTQKGHDTAMVRCKTCGVFLPFEEALSRNGNHYCCPEHAKRY